MMRVRLAGEHVALLVSAPDIGLRSLHRLEGWHRAGTLPEALAALRTQEVLGRIIPSSLQHHVHLGTAPWHGPGGELL